MDHTFVYQPFLDVVQREPIESCLKPAGNDSVDERGEELLLGFGIRGVKSYVFPVHDN